MRFVGDGPPADLTPRGEGVAVPPGQGGCLLYVVDLDGAVSSRWNAGFRSGRTRVVALPMWLWRPRRLSATTRYTVSVSEGSDPITLPWSLGQDESYVLNQQAFRMLSYATLGRSYLAEYREQGAPGHLRVVSVPDVPRFSARDHLLPWVRRHVDVLRPFFKDAAFPSIEVLFVNDGGGGPGASFGMAARGGYRQVVLLVPTGATDAGMEGDWIFPHELVHLTMPYVRRGDAWLSEGVPTYYQEVLRGRRGSVSRAQAWCELHKGFERGRREGSGRTLRQESRDMGRTGNYGAVYWCGAALSFHADVLLRLRGLSLDRLLQHTAQCCSWSARAWSADEVLEEFDRVDSAGTWRALVARYLDGADFPRVRDLWERMGMEVRGGMLKFTEGLLSPIRDSIMGGPPEVSSLPCVR